MKINNRFINKIIKHYLKYDKDNPFIFISSLLAFLGIAAGVMVLMLAMGIMHGTQKEFQKRLFVMNYPITLIPTSYSSVNQNFIDSIKREFPKMKFSPYYTTQVITKSGSSVNGSILYGVDFKKEAELNEVFRKAMDGSLSKDSKYRIVTGEVLAKEMGVYKGQKLTLYFSEQQAIGFGTMPLQKRFVIDSTFDSGLKAYDKAIIYATLDSFQKILKRKEGIYDGVHIYSKDAIADAKKIKKFLAKNALAQSVIVEGWWEQDSSFFAAMEMEKEALFLVLLLIILVASLNIISSLLMTVMSRRKEIALLLSLGCSTQDIKQIFLRLGMIIGVGGIITGVIFGFTGMYILSNFDIISLPADVYGTTKLPLLLDNLDLLYIILGSISIVFISSYYPALKATKIDVLEVLRNE